MSRPRKCRFVDQAPTVTYYKPRGIPLRELDEVVLSVEAFEAIRLSDLEGLTMAEAATGMGVSRHTFGRVLAEGRRAIAQALVRGEALRIEGGCYEVKRRRRSTPQRRTKGQR